MLIYYKHKHELAQEPTKAYKHDACFDLYAVENKTIDDYGVVSTGISMHIPQEFVGMICSRSGLAANRGVFVLNAPGIIDSGYHGEIKIILGNLNHKPYRVKKGDRIAQLMIIPLWDIHLLRADNMVWYSLRGDNGLGSSGD